MERQREMCQDDKWLETLAPETQGLWGAAVGPLSTDALEMSSPEWTLPAQGPGWPCLLPRSPARMPGGSGPGMPASWFPLHSLGLGSGSAPPVPLR